jgi:glycogen debranching enzyme
MVLDGEKNPLHIVSSNPAHLLWSRCLAQAQAEQIRQRLMQPDLLTPWGLRTLSTRAHYYNPLMYHCGTVWPFDNAVAAIGMQRHGFEAEARHVARAVLSALIAFKAA